MRLESKNLYLRSLESSDADGVYPGWLNDPEVCRYNSHGDTLYTPDMARAYIDQVNTDPSIQAFAICLHEDDRHVGNIALQQISLKNRNAELAILIGDTSVYGRGIGYEACRLLIRYAFDTLRLHRLYCGTHSDNRGMRRLALKLGMTEEGYRREALLKNGNFADIVEYGILDYEYQKDLL